MSLSVAGKYAVITGAGSGINLTFARLLLQKGCSVLIGDLKLRPEAEALLSEYPADSSPSALFQPTDVTSWPQLGALMARAAEAFPRLDIVVAGAGVFEAAASSFWEAPATATNPAAATRSRDDGAGEPGSYLTMDANLTHPIRLAQLAIGQCAAGHMAGTGTPLYFASKHGLHGFVRSLGGLRDELGIRVAAVAPATVRTPLWTDDPDKSGLLGEQKANEDLLEPREVAEAMLELLSRVFCVYLFYLYLPSA